MDFDSLLASMKDPETDKVPDTSGQEKFIQQMRELESSGGKNTNHPWMQNGIHKGTRGIGETAFMPLTIKELANRSGDKELKDLAKLDQSGMEKAIKDNPVLEKKLQIVMHDRLSKQMNGDPEKMAYGWQYGHNLNGDQITPDMLANSDRIQKFRNLQEKGKDMPKQMARYQDEDGNIKIGMFDPESGQLIRNPSDPTAGMTQEMGAMTDNDMQKMQRQPASMDFSKLSAVMGRDKSKDPTFGQYVGEKAQDLGQAIKDRYDQGGQDMQKRDDARNNFIKNVQENKGFSSGDIKAMNEDPMDQMGIGSMGLVNEGAPLAKLAQQGEMGLADKLKALSRGELSNGSQSEFSQAMRKSRLRQMMEDQARARDASLANPIKKDPIIK